MGTPSTVCLALGIPTDHCFGGNHEVRFLIWRWVDYSRMVGKAVIAQLFLDSEKQKAGCLRTNLGIIGKLQAGSASNSYGIDRMIVYYFIVEFVCTLFGYQEKAKLYSSILYFRDDL